jgi:hypothetical protein
MFSCNFAVVLVAPSEVELLVCSCARHGRPSVALRCRVPHALVACSPRRSSKWGKAEAEPCLPPCSLHYLPLAVVCSPARQPWPSSAADRSSCRFLLHLLLRPHPQAPPPPCHASQPPPRSSRSLPLLAGHGKQPRAAGAVRPSSQGQPWS